MTTPEMSQNRNITCTKISSTLQVVSACVVALLLALLMTSCGEPSALEKKMREAVENPSMRNEQTFNELTAIILSDTEKYKEYITESGEVDVLKLEQAIERMGKRKDPNFSWKLTEYGGVVKGPLQLRLMLERSGSMTGYDARTGSGDFKRAVSELLTRFPESEKNLFIVNDTVYPYTGTLDSFVQDKDIFASTAGIGNPAYTDFGAIFTYSLTDNVPERITVLITDMIYSPEDTEGVSLAKIFNEEQTLANTLFNAHKDKSVIVVKLSGDFHGTYYPYGQPSGVKYDGARPYYMIITGSAAAMQKLRSAPEYSSFVDFKSLPGYQADYFFNRNTLPVSYYTVMPKGKGCKGSYSLDGEDGANGIHGLKDVTPDRGSDTYTFRVAADLSQIPATAQYLLDKSNYTVKGSSLDKVEIITPEMIDPRTKRYMERATHLFTFTGTGKGGADVCEISLKNHLPDWISKSSASSDTNLRDPNFPVTTLGFGNFMRGIYNAYYGTGQVPDFTSFSIKITR